MSQKKVYLDFQDGNGFVEVSDYVIYDTLTISRNGFNDAFSSAQSECSFSMKYSSTFFPLLTANTLDIIVYITESGTDYFYGHIPFNRNWKYNGIADNTIISLEAVDDTDYLDVEVGDIVYADCAICDPLNPSKSIVHLLATIAGFEDRVDDSVTIDTVIDRFAPKNETNTVYDLISTLAYEYGYVFNLNASGDISFIKWNLLAKESIETIPGAIGGGSIVFPINPPEIVSPVHTFDESNIIKEINIVDKTQRYDSVEVKHYELENLEKVRIYTDSNCGYGDGGTFDGYPIPPTYFYPPKANVIDESTGTNQIVYQEYTDDAIEYYTNKAIAEQLNYNYKNFDSDFSGIVATENHVIENKYDIGISLDVSEFGNKKARLLYKNNNVSDYKSIYYNNIYADVWYKTSEREIVVYPKGSKQIKPTKITLDYVYDGDIARWFARALSKQIEIGSTKYSFLSDDYVAEGSPVNITLAGSTSLGIIQSVSYEEYSEQYKYTCILASLDRDAIAYQIARESVAVKETVPYELVPSSQELHVPYVHNVGYDYSEVFAELKVMRAGLDYSQNWSINADSATVTGTWVGNSYYITDVPSGRGVVTFTASKIGWDDLVVDVIVSRDAIREAIDDAVPGGSTTPPSNVGLVTSRATQTGIDISWSWVSTLFNNVINYFTVEITKDSGNNWTSYKVKDSNFSYMFDRDVDGYPEASDFSTWGVRVKATNVYGVTSIDWSTSAINTTHYKTWIMSVPAIHAKASGRSVDIKLYKENDFYGDYEFRVQISKDSGANWNELGDSSLAWIDESSYKGPGEYTELIFEAYRQVLPLTGQASDEPVDTEYWYRVALYHKQTTQTTTYTTPFIVVCKPSSAKDLVSGAVKNAQLATGAVTHDKIAARTIQTENLFVTARSKINTLSNADDGISGWTGGTRFADGSRFGLELVAPNHKVDSDEFTVEPNEIVEVSFGLQLVDAAGSTGYFGINFGSPGVQTFTRYVWDTTTKKWTEPLPETNAYFIRNYQGSSIQFVKTFVLGSNVNIKDVPAPSVSTARAVYCLQLSVGDVKCRLRSGFNPVNNGYTWRLYQPLAVTIGQSKIVAEQIEVKNLSAINSHLGEIKGDTEDYKLVMGSGGSAEEGTLLLGATTDESYLRRWKEGGIWKMALKLASFIVDAVSSKVLGQFEVKNSTDTATHLTVDNTTGATIVSGGGDVSLSAGTGRLLIGNPAAGHMAIDENEIQAKTNGTTPGTLYLNNNGGRVECGEDLKVAGVLSSARAQIANTFIDSGVSVETQDGFLIKTDIPPTVNRMTFLEFTMNAYAAGYPCIGIVQCYPYATDSAIIHSKYSAIGGAPAYCRIFFTNNVLCFWLPKTGNYQILHPVLHTASGSYKIVSTTAAALPATRDREVTANVLLPWSSINDGPGSGLDADLVRATTPGTRGLQYLAAAAVSNIAALILADLKTVDGSGSGLDADTVDGVDFVNGSAGTYGSVLIAGSSTWIIPKGTYMLAADSHFMLAISNDSSNWFTGIGSCSGLIISDGVHYRIYNSLSGESRLHYRKLA